MALVICSLYDSAAESYSHPLPFKSLGEAIRSIQDALRDDKSKLAAWPEHFSLFQIGTFDEHEGVLQAVPPKLVINVWSLVKAEPATLDNVAA